LNYNNNNNKYYNVYHQCLIWKIRRYCNTKNYIKINNIDMNETNKKELSKRKHVVVSWSVRHYFHVICNLFAFNVSDSPCRSLYFLSLFLRITFDFHRNYHDCPNLPPLPWTYFIGWWVFLFVYSWILFTWFLPLGCVFSEYLELFKLL